MQTAVSCAGTDDLCHLGFVNKIEIDFTTKRGAVMSFDEDS